MSYRAQWEIKTAYLNTDFGLEYACKALGLTPAQVEEKVGRYTKGARKGQLRGLLQWVRVTRGGWVRTAPGYGDGERSQGFVVRPGLRCGHQVVLWGGAVVLGFDGDLTTGGASAMLERRQETASHLAPVQASVGGAASLRALFDALNPTAAYETARALAHEVAK